MIDKFCCQNGKTLKILDLDRCSGLDLNSIQAIVQNCFELREANFAHTKLSKRSIDFLTKNITRKIKKLSLFGLDVSDENINVLVSRCSQLSALSLGMDFFLFGQDIFSQEQWKRLVQFVISSIGYNLMPDLEATKLMSQRLWGC